MAFATQMWFLMERYEQQRELEDFSTPLVSDYLFEKDKLFAYINLSDAELDLYNRYYQMFRADVPTPELVIYCGFARGAEAADSAQGRARRARHQRPIHRAGGRRL